MMTKTIQCDRCGKLVAGTCDQTGNIETTSGYYNVTSEGWREFARWEEEHICDMCMHNDPKYRQRYFGV